MKKKTFWMSDEDQSAISEIVSKYGCASESQAVRMAVRSLAKSHQLNIALPELPVHARKSPKIST